MITDIKLPKLGVEMETARLAEWTVAEGDAVASGDTIANVETEKVVFELPAPAAGRIHLVGELDEEYAIGDHLGAIAETDEEYSSLLEGAPAPAPAPAPAAAASAPVVEQETAVAAPRPAAPAVSAPGLAAAVGNGAKVLATPVAKRMAGVHGIDLGTLTGSGRQGVVRRRDVEAAIAAGPSMPETAVAAGNGHAAPAGAESTVQKLSSMRRTIATRMHASMQSTAQMTDIREQDVTKLVELRARAAARADALGFKLTFTALFARAALIALQRVPLLNSSLESETELRQYEAVNLGMAVAIPEGLLVPVVHGAERLSIRQLNDALVELIGKARDRTASAEEMAGGTFTITNFGSFGSHMGTPILMPPQVGILGIGAMLDRPVVRDGEVAVGKVVYTCLTVDHRVIDGETAGHFQNELGALLADPDLLLFG
jgi:pyruvate dehydrogenase E2 component (dihydrolipoamide acetyltransferase)